MVMTLGFEARDLGSTPDLIGLFVVNFDAHSFFAQTLRALLGAWGKLGNRRLIFP